MFCLFVFWGVAEIKIPGIVKSLAFMLATVAIVSITSSVVVSFLAPPSEVQRLTLEYRSAGSLSSPLALMTILLDTSIFTKPLTAGVWWIVGGFVAGFVIKFFRSDPVSLVFWVFAGMFTPVVAGIITGSMINANVLSSPPGMAGFLATRNILGGVLSALAAHYLGARVGQIAFASRVAAYEARLHEELFNAEIEPLQLKCPECGAELYSETLYCSSCGSPLSKTTPKPA